MKKIFALIYLSVCCTFIYAQDIEKQIGDSLTRIANAYSYIGKVSGVKLETEASTKTLIVKAPEKLSYIPFRQENVARMYAAIKSIVGAKYATYTIKCVTNDQPIENLIPNFFRNKINYDSLRVFQNNAATTPLITSLSRPYSISQGLQNKHLALWHSHGWYYNQQLARWEWQRTRLFQTVEDIYTLSYTLPFLAPMLENAGATVLMPRERDFNKNEVIVDEEDDDKNSHFETHRRWRKSDNGTGFANLKKTYLFGENPFHSGTYREIKTTTDSDRTAMAEWTPDIPEAGRYAVYISYATVANSTSDARYTVFHKGGETSFSINQTMGGGTWIYLGTFCFDAGRSESQRVVLSNFSAEKGKTLVADAVKFGGGMGNIARNPNPATYPNSPFVPETSGRPRWVEGARYWLQWAGVPDSVYSRTANTNDYTDDFTSRGFWVNWLAGGSSVIPSKAGLNIPIDLAVGLHTDAGSRMNDSIIGTLGIFSVPNTEKSLVYQNGTSRWAARDLADIVQTQIVADIRQTYAPKWTMRNLWNKSYSESREPEVPALLLELLAHQNFADMRYGLDPRFQFTVSRAIYKGILRYLAANDGTDYVVQPLPVKNISCQFINNNTLQIDWTPVFDALEPTAAPEKYIVYTRIDEGGFDNGTVVDANHATVSNIEEGKIYSFKVAAVNAGGEGFPSEVVAACRAPQSKGEVLIVNGFDRLAAPASFVQDSLRAGFATTADAGVPYLYGLNFTGNQYDFDRKSDFISNDVPGFGASHANHEAQIVAGNSFDYAFIHGKAAREAGFSFVSCAKGAVTESIELANYKIVDLILGKQRKTFIGNQKAAPEFELVPLFLQNAITTFAQNGGKLLVSGAYIGSDLVKSSTNAADKSFLENTLKCKFIRSEAALGGKVNMVQSPIQAFAPRELHYHNLPNEKMYFVESPDALAPVAKGYTIARYAENGLSAAVAYTDSTSKICVFAFPLETIEDEQQRNTIIGEALLFLQ
ncbi:MAG: fibronectin type III domain-containing protein [Prevotellaceae bacterium]|jgi:hypothetical protein|nr:fibronectin type III domain-containing protein [Prevotellaceae bacterium]